MTLARWENAKANDEGSSDRLLLGKDTYLMVAFAGLCRDAVFFPAYGIDKVMLMKQSFKRSYGHDSTRLCKASMAKDHTVSCYIISSSAPSKSTLLVLDCWSPVAPRMIKSYSRSSRLRKIRGNSLTRLGTTKPSKRWKYA